MKSSVDQEEATRSLADGLVGGLKLGGPSSTVAYM